MKNLTKLSGIMIALSVGITSVGTEMLMSAPVSAATTYSSSVESSITSLAKMIDLDVSVANDITGTSAAAQVLQVLRSSSMDWNQVMFGTDTLSAQESATSSSLLGDVQQLISLQTTSSTSLIDSIIQNMVSLNATIQPADVVSFLNLIVGGAYTEIGQLKSLNPINGSTVAAALHTAFTGYLAGTTPAIQALFGYTGGSASVGGAGAVGGSSTTGTAPTPPTGSGNAFTNVLQSIPVTTAASSISQDLGNGVTVGLKIPADAFSSSETVTLTSGTASDMDSLLKGAYANLTPIYTFGVSFSGNPPTMPITLTINSASIPSDAQVFKVNSDGSLTPASSVSANGMITISFSSDPDFVVASNSHVITPPTVILPSWPGYLTKAIELDGKTVYEVPSLVNKGTTYMPIWYVMQTLQKFGFQSKWNGQSWQITTPSSVSPDYSNVKIGTGTGVYLNGKLIERVPAMTKMDPTSKHNTTYMPIWYVQQALDRAHITNTWDSKSWRISSSTSTSSN